MIGAGTSGVPEKANQSLAIAAHLDRYTLREDAVPQDRSEELIGIVCHEELLAKLETFAAGLVVDLVTPDLPSSDFSIDCDENISLRGIAYRVPWWGGPTVLILIKPTDRARLCDYLAAMGGIQADESEFHRRRIETRFPWFGVDIDGANLPQEADRDTHAISFTKGCYLGQETVARLDALGQVQKKLVRWDLHAQSAPAVNSELKEDDRVVGRLTSVAKGDGSNQFVALGFARRSHFEPGSVAVGVMEDGGKIEALVN